MEGGKGRQQQYLINQGIIQNKTKQWEEEVLDRRCYMVKIPRALSRTSDCIRGARGRLGGEEIDMRLEK